jgi:hypothetical protein
MDELRNISELTIALAPSPSNTEYERLFQITQLITGLYLLPFVSLFGIIGSIFNLVVYKNSKKCSTNVYLIALSMSDIVKLLNDFLYFLVSVITKLDEDLGTYLFNAVYLYSHYIFVFTAINTAWLTCVIAFDRYIAVVEYQGKQKYRQYHTSIVASVCVMLCSLVFAVPSPLFLMSTSSIDPSTNATVSRVGDSALNKTQFKKMYNYFNAVIRAFIPLILICYLNFKILQVIYRNKMKAKFKKAVVKTKNEVKTRSSVTMMLFLIAFTFAIFMFPDAIMTMMQLGYANEDYLVRSIREVTDLLLAVNSSTTFPICYYFSIQYRNMFKDIFMTSECSKRRRAAAVANDKTTVATTTGNALRSTGNLADKIEYEEKTVFLNPNTRLKVDQISLASSYEPNGT